jgi:hypothetical protein
VITLRGIIALLALLLLVVNGGAAATFAQATPSALEMADLPAIILAPNDAKTIGIDGLGRFENGHYRTLSEYSLIRSDFLQIPLEEVEAAMEDAGYLQGYTSNLGIPAEPGNPQSPPSRVVFSSIYEYGSPEGAAAAFAFNTNYDGVTIANVDSSIQPSVPFGDEFVMTRTSATEMEEEGPSDQVDTVFRVGNIIAAAGIIDYGMTAESLATPTAADPELVLQVEQLANRLIERIGIARSESALNLSSMALTLTSESADPAGSSEGYRRIDGEDIPYFNGYEDDLPEYLTSDMVAVYEVAQALGDPAADMYDPYFATRLFLFDEQNAAALFLDGIEAVPGADSATVPDGAATIGSDARLIQYDVELSPGVTVHGYQLWQLDGNTVALTLFESADHRPDLQAMLDLGAAQSDCLQNGCESVPMPDVW